MHRSNLNHHGPYENATQVSFISNSFVGFCVFICNSLICRVLCFNFLRYELQEFQIIRSFKVSNYSYNQFSYTMNKIWKMTIFYLPLPISLIYCFIPSFHICMPWPQQQSSFGQCGALTSSIPWTAHATHDTWHANGPWSRRSLLSQPRIPTHHPRHPHTLIPHPQLNNILFK